MRKSDSLVEKRRALFFPFQDGVQDLVGAQDSRFLPDQGRELPKRVLLGNGLFPDNDIFR